MRLPTAVTSDAWLWLGGSVLIALIWTNLSWLFAPWTKEETPGNKTGSLAEIIVFRTVKWRFARSVYQVLRAFYYVAIPATALFWGRDAVVRRYIGLQPLALPTEGGPSASAPVSANWSEWAYDLGWAAMLGVGAGTLLVLARLTYRRAVSEEAAAHQPSGRRPALVIARETLYHETHWAFYRNAPIVALGPYWGTWVGLALVGLEAALNPRWRRDLNSPYRGWSVATHAALAVVSTLLFLGTQNLWLAFLLHGAIALVLGAPYGAAYPDATQTLVSGD